MIKILILINLYFMLASCSTTPTGRKQLRLISASQMDQLGDESFQAMKGKSPIDSNQRDNNYVRCITDNLLISMGENPQAWEVKLFRDKSLNAFALPGNNIGVHTGMLNFVDDQHQLAAVLGHEIAHVLAQHGNERVSQNMLISTGLQMADLVISADNPNSKYILAGLGVGAQFGVLLPFSRSHETEADLLGMQYMAKAGFDPNGAVGLWQKMQKNSGSRVPEFLSTHPSNSSRIENLKANIPKYYPFFLKQQIKPNCKR